jgi:hypothetical protein
MRSARVFLVLLLAAPAAVSAPRGFPDDEVVAVSPFLGSGGKTGPVG